MIDDKKRHKTRSFQCKKKGSNKNIKILEIWRICTDIDAKALAEIKLS